MIIKDDKWKPRCFGREYSGHIDEDYTCRVCIFVEECMKKCYRINREFKSENWEDIK